MSQRGFAILIVRRLVADYRLPTTGYWLLLTEAPMSSDPTELRGRTHVWNEDHSLGQTRANMPGNGPAVGTPVKMTGGIANAVDPATVHQPEATTKPLMLMEMGKR